jgi:ferric-chelate reductase
MSYTSLVLFLITLIAIVRCDVLTPFVTQNEYPNNKTVLDGFTLYWQLDAAKNSIEFGIVAKTTGWVAVGFGSSDGMTNADAIIGYFDAKEQKAVVQDAYLEKLGAPPVFDSDRSNGFDNILASNGGFVNGETHLKFVRRLNVTSQNDPWDKSITAGATSVSVAYNKATTDMSVAHTDRGRTTITFIPAVKPKYPPLRFHWYITAAVLISTMLLGLFTTGALLPARYKRNGVFHFVLYRNLSQYFDNKYLRWFDHVADLTIGEIYMIIMYLILCVTWFMQEYVGAIRWGEPSPFGRGLAWITIVNLSFILLPVTRNSVWFYIFGITYEKALKFHRGIARWNLFTMALHAIFMLIEYGFKQAWVYDTVTAKYTLAGTLSWVLLSIGAVLGYEPIRRRIFEWFVAIHVILGMLSFVLIIIHAKVNQTVPFMAAGFVLYLLDLFIRFAFGVCVPATLLEAEYLEKAGVTKLVIRKKSLRGFKPGQHVYLWIGAVSKGEWHPFSIANVHEDGSFTLYIKNMGSNTNDKTKWTSRLADLAQSVDPIGVTSTHIRVEGPYGAPAHDHEQYETVVLIAGGIGITALYGIFQELIKKNKKVLLLWSVRTREMWNLYEELLSEETSFGECAEVRLHVTSVETTDQENIGSGVVVCPGRIDFNQLLADVSEVASKDGYVSVCACGPEDMTRAVRMACWDQSKNGIKFHFYKEVFSL